ncbi:MAG: 3'-5' exonuclease [Alphaproteobacteria bacterium GWF2_58_20]|nr:MAG: 3'-5' exonuclease [Alphaproteobacteria bacterium GWF2_58_20]
MAIFVHEGDLPEGLSFGNSVAVDTETMGLIPSRDRLCVVQLSAGDGHAHLVTFPSHVSYSAPNLCKLLADRDVLKIFHYGRADMAFIRAYLGVTCTPVYCTKIASRLARTNAPSHSLAPLCRDLLGITLNKEQQCTDWGTGTLTEEQQVYAASDVLYLHALKEKLDAILEREGRDALAEPCFAFLPYRVELDLAGWPETDIFAHH